MDNLVTSYSNSGISLFVSTDSIVMNKLPSANIFKDAFIFVCDEKYNEMLRIKVCPEKHVEVSLSGLPDGKYFFCLYLRLPEKQDMYYPYLNYGDVPFLIHSHAVELLSSLVLDCNNAFANSINSFSKYDKRILAPTYHVQSNNLNLRKLAVQIANGLSDKMSIIKAVHSWVALNISYDYDSLVDDAHVEKDNTALGAYVGRKCVCRGYTHLCVALLRALHIPAIKIYCRALYVLNDGSWWERNNVNLSANHVFPAAWNGTRWVFMDTTWDSRNVYEDGHFAKGSSSAYPYKYFDVSLDFISQTHKFLSFDF